MSSPKKVPDTFFAAALGLGLVLVVVIAAAAIRLQIGIPGLRVAHRIAASAEVLVVLWLLWMDWRRPAVLVALALTVLLSIVGIIGGQDPPPAIAAVNLLGGLSLAAVFACMLSPERRPAAAPAVALAAMLAAQLALGTWLAIVDRAGAVLPAHALLAVALAGLLGWFALGRVRGTHGKLLFALALAAPVAGFTTLQYERSAAAALAHALAAASLLVVFALAMKRGQDPFFRKGS